MKKILLLAILLGCANPTKTAERPTKPATPKITTLPPVPPAPVRRTTRAAASIAESFTGHGFVPKWTFTNSGDYRIEASTNLVSWWPIAVVYGVTNLEISSDIVNKRAMMFYRVLPQ